MKDTATSGSLYKVPCALLVEHNRLAEHIHFYVLPSDGYYAFAFNALVVKVLSDKDSQASPKVHERIGAGQYNHFPHFGMPLIVHALCELLKGYPGVDYIPGEDVGIQSDQVFGEVYQKERADAYCDGCAWAANNRGDEQAIHYEGAERNPA